MNSTWKPIVNRREARILAGAGLAEDLDFLIFGPVLLVEVRPSTAARMAEAARPVAEVRS